MARLDRRLPENAPGDLYVDTSCIDCDACRQIAPATFDRSDEGERSFVFRQPRTDEERRRAGMALVTCPTSSIGSEKKLRLDDAVRSLPEPIEAGVHYCGYASESSFGASSYLVARGGGNVLVDSPRAARPLLDRIEGMGGVRTMFLTHRDDVADHAKVRARFGCERVLHRADRTAETEEVERLVEGVEPVRLASDLVAIPVPGHTRGSMALLYAETFLFSGDHLWWSEEAEMLHASRGVCWWSWSEQVRSIERLLDHRFEWVLPGHGRRHRARSAAEMRGEVEKLLARIRRG